MKWNSREGVIAQIFRMSLDREHKRASFLRATSLTRECMLAGDESANLPGALEHGTAGFVAILATLQSASCSNTDLNSEYLLMPAPRIFVSSTCYDLKYIRENLRFFIRNLGYDPVLSEDGAVFYDPKLHVRDACISEVPICQIFVLIIGGRYGSVYKGKSITNAEYEAAVKAKLPIFALVERDVLEQSRVYAANKTKLNKSKRDIVYPAVDNTLVFEFIEDVQAHAINNALVPFSDFEEMQGYLKRQWANMLHQYLTTESEAKRVSDILQAIAKSSDKVEYFYTSANRRDGRSDYPAQGRFI
jgi:Domain of unknown function (DUF4062)